MTNTVSCKGHTASMIFDAEDKIIVGRVLVIDDVISFHGESVAAFERDFAEVVDSYSAASEALGMAANEPEPAGHVRSGA